jgi:hypothetical protein
MLKVGLTGAHGVGKTTLATQIVRLLGIHGINAQQTPEVPREIITEAGDPHFFRRGKNTLSRQLHILVRQIDIERTIDGPQVLICDRTLLDHWAYTLALFPRFGDAIIRRIWGDFVIKYLQRSYGVIFYLPIEFLARDDGVREDNMDFQQKIDTLIQHHLERAGVIFVTVHGSLKRREKMCLDEIKRHL